MPDDLTAMLRREMPEGVECGTGDVVVRFTVAPAVWDALAARLAEVVREHILALTETAKAAITVMEEQLVAAREERDHLRAVNKEMEELHVALLREVLDCGESFDAPWCDAAWDKARAYLARREEANRA